MGRLFGRIGGKYKGYYIEAELTTENSKEIKGELGGKLTGHNIDMYLSPEETELSGYIGNGDLMKAVKLSLHKEGDKRSVNYDAIGRLSGNASNCDVSIEGSEAEGFFGRIGEKVGFDINLMVSSEKDKITGRLGGKIKGANVDVCIENFSPVLGIVIVALTYNLYLEVEQ